MNALVWAWVGLAVLNVRLARRRNRSGLNWLVVSLLTGPLATALILVWPPLPESGREEVTPRQLASGAAVATVGVILCLLAAVGLGGGIPLVALSGLYLVGVGVFAPLC